MLDRIIDIHCHILPGIDDGPQSLDESISMIRQAVEQGIDTIIATPHYIPGEIEYDKKIVTEKVKLLQDKVNTEKLNCKIYSGMELYLLPSLIKHFDENKILSLADSKYVLVEFPAEEVSPNLINLLYEIQIRGYLPIIAHPERNIAILQNPSLVNDIMEHKVLFQVNASSIIGSNGPEVQKLVLELIKQGLVSFIGSDAHSSSRRSFKMHQAVTHLNKLNESGKCQQLGVTNAEKVLGGSEVSIRKASREKAFKIKKDGFFSKLFWKLNKK